jgi:hypothetical protein
LEDETVTIKVTILIQQATAISTPNSPIHRIGGWSESWYYPGTDVNAAISFFNLMPAPTWCLDRAALLPYGASIVGQRFQLVAPSVGPAQSTAAQFPGNGGEGDQPSAALLLKFPSVGSPNIRRVILRGLPDIDVTEGEYTPSSYFQSALQVWIQACGTLLMRGRDLTQPTTRIITVTSAGVVTTETPTTFAAGQMVRVLKSRDTGGNLRGGRFQVVQTGPLVNQFTLLNWPYSGTTGGTVRLDAIVYPQVSTNGVTVSRVITRRVGRPFVQYRGRRSRRRT